MKELKMETFQANILAFKEQLRKGAIQPAYQGLIAYILQLRTYFQKNHPDFSVARSIYPGYLDMTYFSIFPPFLKERQLKIALVFVYDPFRFEVWLAAKNKRIQEKFWRLFQDSDWRKHHLVPSTDGHDAILEHVLVEDPDFSDPESLTRQIDAGTLDFIRQVEGFLSHQNIDL